MEDVKKMVIKNKMKPATAITSISLVITLSLLLFTGALISSNDNNVLAKKDGGDSGGEDKGSSIGDGGHHDSGSSKGGSGDGGDRKRIAKPKPEGGSGGTGDSGSNVPPAGGNGNVVSGSTDGAGGSTTGGGIGGGEGLTPTTPGFPGQPPVTGQPGQPQCDSTSTECPQPPNNQPTPPCDPAKDATCNQPTPPCESAPGTTCPATPPPGTCPDGSAAVDGKCPPPTCNSDIDKNCPPPVDCKLHRTDPICLPRPPPPCDSAKEKCCRDGSKPDGNGKCIPEPIIPCIKGVSHLVGDHCVLNNNCHFDNGHDGNITCIITIHGHIKEIHRSNSRAINTIVVLPSKPNDFANKDPSTLTLDFVHASGPDAIGNYWIKGEIMNNQKSLHNLKITAHWFDSNNNLVGVTFAYADKQPDLKPEDRSTFSVLADGRNDLTGTPRSVELSYDWQ